MPVERHDTCLGNAPRERKKEEVKLTFQKHRRRNVEAEGAEDGKIFDDEEGSLEARARG
jgi:hypothetical protein